MSKQQLVPPLGARPMGPYSPGLKVGNLVFLSGQGPVDPQGTIVGATIEEQTEKVLENVRLILAEAGATMGDVVKVTAHLSDLALFDRYNRVYLQHFPDPKPVRTTVGSQLLGILVEIDVIAVIGADA
jgi:2-iminobutanoate/2-iminopropanoate deaminase